MTKITFTGVLLVAMASTTAFADKDADYSHLPTRVQQTIREYKGEGEVKKVKTQRLENGQIAYEVDYKERGDEKQILIGQDGFVIGDEQQVKKGRGKDGKKNKHKDKGEGGRNNEGVITVPSVDEGKHHDSESRPAVSAPVAKNRSSQELKTDLQNHIRVVNSIDNKAAAFKSGMSAVARETGVSVAKVQEQHRTHPTAGIAGLLIANEIATHTRKPITPYIRQHISEGKGWHEIATANGVDIATLNNKLDRVQQAIAQK